MVVAIECGHSVDLLAQNRYDYTTQSVEMWTCGLGSGCSLTRPR